MKIKDPNKVGERRWVAHSLERLLKQHENFFHKELQRLIDEGLLEIELGQAHIVVEESLRGDHSFKISRRVHFKVAGEEYVKALQSKIEELEDKLLDCKLALGARKL